MHDEYLAFRIIVKYQLLKDLKKLSELQKLETRHDVP